MHGTRWLTQHIPSVLNRLVNYRFGRVLILGQSHGRPSLVTADQGRAAIAAMGTCVGFAATLKATAHLRYQATRVDHERLPPTTVAFGSRDLILLRRGWRRTDELPPETVTRTLHRCGHIPMADDPVAVAKLITASATTPSVHREARPRRTGATDRVAP